MSIVFSAIAFAFASPPNRSSYSSLKLRMQLGSSPTNFAPCSMSGNTLSTFARALAFALSMNPFDSIGRPQHPTSGSTTR